MPFNLDEFLPYRLNVAATQISRRFAALHQERSGLSIPEWRVMAHLANEGAVSVRDIHKRVNLDKSIVSRAASRMESAGLLRKSGHETDRRLIALELTEKGHDLMQDLGRIADAFQAELRAELGKDAASFEAGLDRLIASGATEEQP